MNAYIVESDEICLEYRGLFYDVEYMKMYSLSINYKRVEGVRYLEDPKKKWLNLTNKECIILHNKLRYYQCN